jgi:hypothetical protein
MDDTTLGEYAAPIVHAMAVKIHQKGGERNDFLQIMSQCIEMVAAQVWEPTQQQSDGEECQTGSPLPGTVH